MKRRGKPSREIYIVEACKDGALIFHVILPNEDSEPVRIEPNRVAAVLVACGDALAKKPRARRGRAALAFEACTDGSLFIYAAVPREDGEPIRIEPCRVWAVLAACGEALARRPSRR